MTEEPIINDGALIGRRLTDFVAGEEVGVIPYEVRNPSGDWNQFLPPGEWQGNRKADSMSCVTYSALNSVEAQEKLLTGTQNNYSDRWTAKRSGTMRNGNYLWKVADTIRKEGLVLQESYPTPTEYTWDEFHVDIPEPLSSKLLQEGSKWLEKFSIAYEWIPVTRESFEHHLKHAPIQIVFPNHAVLGIYQMSDITRFFDSYEPYVKDKQTSNLTDALKIVLTPKNMTKFLKVNDHGKLGIMILEGFSGTIIFENDYAEYQALLKITGIDDSTPTIDIP